MIRKRNDRRRFMGHQYVHTCLRDVLEQSDEKIIFI